MAVSCDEAAGSLAQKLIGGSCRYNLVHGDDRGNEFREPTAAGAFHAAWRRASENVRKRHINCLIW